MHNKMAEAYLVIFLLVIFLFHLTNQPKLIKFQEAALCAFIRLVLLAQVLVLGNFLLQCFKKGIT